MSRIRKFYENRFRRLAVKLGKTSEEVAHASLDRAAALRQREHLHPDLALALVHADLRRATGETAGFPQRFLCDGGLGGLARWLRAAGYESAWNPELDDAGIIAEAKQAGATLLTTDTMMMERGVLRDGWLPAICVPSSLKRGEQLAVVLREAGLELRPPRCMACGGELRPVPRETIASRIPPRTALWLKDYFVCAQCHQLFWHGTHWRKIARELERSSRVGCLDLPP